MGDRDRMQGAGEFALPEIQKVDENRETGRQIIFLPDIGLQEARVIRHAVEDLGGRQPIALHLADEVLGNHANSFSQAPAHRAEKWTRFSAPNDALFKAWSIGWIPKVEGHFWVRCSSKPFRQVSASMAQAVPCPMLKAKS